MRIISRTKLKECWEQHPDCETQLKSWFREFKNGSWNGPAELKRCYPGARLLKDNRVVFNIKGNNYRIIVWINYDFQTIYIRFVGTHAEYDKVNVNTI